MPRHAIPEMWELWMREVRGAVESVAVLAPEFGTDLSRLFDDIPRQGGMIEPVDGAPALGVADRLIRLSRLSRQIAALPARRSNTFCFARVHFPT